MEAKALPSPTAELRNLWRWLHLGRGMGLAAVPWWDTPSVSPGGSAHSPTPCLGTEGTLGSVTITAAPWSSILTSFCCAPSLHIGPLSPDGQTPYSGALWHVLAARCLRSRGGDAATLGREARPGHVPGTAGQGWGRKAPGVSPGRGSSGLRLALGGRQAACMCPGREPGSGSSALVCRHAAATTRERSLP